MLLHSWVLNRGGGSHGAGKRQYITKEKISKREARQGYKVRLRGAGGNQAFKPNRIELCAISPRYTPPNSLVAVVDDAKIPLGR